MAASMCDPAWCMHVRDFRPDIPVGCLEGLEQYSHVWILFVFHCNTDLQRLWSPSHAADGLKAKVQVPRLNGGRMGVLATRSPHRPAPIGAPFDSPGSCRLWPIVVACCARLYNRYDQWYHCVALCRPGVGRVVSPRLHASHNDPQGPMCQWNRCAMTSGARASEQPGCALMQG